MEDLTGVQRDILVILSGEEATPPDDIVGSLEEYYDEPTKARVSIELEELHEKGLVTRHTTEITEDSVKHTYELSPEGKQQLIKYYRWKCEKISNIEFDIDSDDSLVPCE